MIAPARVARCSPRVRTFPRHCQIPMGLTLHYRLTAPTGCTARRAAALVRRLHATATTWAAAGRFETVDPITSDRGLLDRFGNAWLTLPHPDDPETRVGVCIPAETGWLFPVDLSADCEWLWLGLCRYPATITHGGRSLATKLGPHWQLAASCKTQYASRRGWEHFARCHMAAIDLLGAGRDLGLRVKITDEGGYWPRRNLATLRQNLDRMNGIVAALAGVMKDATDGDGGSPVQSPIFAHPQFERLEAEGAARTGANLAKAAQKIIQSLGSPPGSQAP